MYLLTKAKSQTMLVLRTENGTYCLYFSPLGFFESLGAPKMATSPLVECDVLSLLKRSDGNGDYVDVLFNNMRRCYTGLNSIPVDLGMSIQGRLLDRPLFRTHMDGDMNGYVQSIIPLKSGLYGSIDEVAKEIGLA